MQPTDLDRTSGEVHLRSFLESPRVSGTVFESLRNPAVFRQVRVDLGAVADLTLDAMYDAARAQGHRMSDASTLG